MTTFEEYLKKVYSEKPDGARLGQWAMNSLIGVRDDIYHGVLHTTLDPYYLDERMPYFIDHVAILWSVELTEQEIQHNERMENDPLYRDVIHYERN